MRIVLVDDHKMLRDGLRAVLEKAGMEVIGEAQGGRDSIALVHRLRPDIVVMDISMADLNGVDATRRLIAENPKLKVIGLSMNSDRRYVVAMFQAGAVGYLLKNAAAEELIQAVHAVASDLTYVSPSIAATIVDHCVDGERATRDRDPRTLSPREREVLQLLAEGKSSKDIAVHLDVAVPTVETHRRQIMDKLGLRTVAELTKYAIREGLTSVD